MIQDYPKMVRFSNGRFYNQRYLHFQPLSVSHTHSLSVSPAASPFPFFCFDINRTTLSVTDY
jgi:hypothetical protein